MDIELIPYHDKHFNDVFSLVHRTIEEIYPLYYPGEAEYRIHPLPEGGKLCYFHMKKALNAPLFSYIDYNGRVFRSSSNSETGEVNESTLFYYRQEGSIVWAEYSGGSIARGFLLGITDSKGALSFSYTSGEIRTGRGVSNPVFLPDGRVQMNEKWKWTNGDGSEGESVITEVINGEE